MAKPAVRLSFKIFLNIIIKEYGTLNVWKCPKCRLVLLLEWGRFSEEKQKDAYKGYLFDACRYSSPDIFQRGA